MHRVFEHYYFRLTRLLVSGVGEWPFQSSRQKRFFRILVLGAMHSGVPPMVAALIILWGTSLRETIKCFPPLLTITACDVKILASHLNGSKITDILLQIKSDWETIEGEERKVILEYMKKGRVVVGLYTTYIYVSLVIFINIPLVPYLLDVLYGVNETRIKMLLFPVYYGTDPDANWIWYVLHSHAISTATITIVVACDSMYITLVFYNCGMFATVRYCLERIGERDESTNQEINQNSRKIVFERIRKCVVGHHKAIRYATTINSIYVWSFLSIVAINMIIISITGLQVMISLDEWHEFVPAGIYTCAQLLHLLLLSLPGQLLINESESVRDSAYKSIWYDIPTNAQKMLILLLLRSMDPCEITAGKMFVIKMETFTTILQTSASYFTMLASLQ